MKWRVSTTEAEARPHPAPAADAKTVQTAPAQRPAIPIGQSCRLSRPGSRCENRADGTGAAPRRKPCGVWANIFPQQTDVEYGGKAQRPGQGR